MLLHIYGQIGLLNDKSNAYRLVKLGNHTTPTFGHVRMFSDMRFETVH